MNNLVTFFAEGDKGIKLVGIGITDLMIEHLKKAGGILQESERTGQNIDVVLMYAPDVDGLVKKIKDVTGSADKIQFRVI